MANIVSFQFSENYWRQIENIVFMQLRRNNSNIFYHKANHECDFIATENRKVIQAIQVCRSLDDRKTRERELNGLMEAMKEHRLSEGLIITDEEEEIIENSDQKIRVLPCWKWLLGYNGE